MKKILILCAALLALGALTACNNTTPQPIADTTIVTADTAEHATGGMMSTVDAEKFSKIIKMENVILLDVRTPDEYAEGHIDGAVNIDVKANDFDERTKDITGKVAVYCRSGKRSRTAGYRLIEHDCIVFNLDGGIKEWTGNGLPVVTQ